VPQKTVRDWITDEKWEDLVHEDPGDTVNLSPKTKDLIEEKVEDFGLTEQERIFCYHYLKTFNQTTAAARAGYSPKVCYDWGSKLMNKPRVKKFIKYLKGQRDEEVFVDTIDIVKQYIKIAFADITDIVKFKGEDMVLKSPSEVDGSLISEISQGRMGIKIKLHDKLEALKRLERFYFVLPEDTKLEIEKAKLELMKKKHELDEYMIKGDGTDKDQEGINSFIKATKSDPSDVKELFNHDEK
jgi:phage terminase small subunit